MTATEYQPYDDEKPDIDKLTVTVGKTEDKDGYISIFAMSMDVEVTFSNGQVEKQTDIGVPNPKIAFETLLKGLAKAGYYYGV